jgi:hypothetical protein
MPRYTGDDRSLIQAVAGDGRPLLVFTGLALVLSGAFALFQSATGQFLPQDVAFLQMSARDLCGLDQCRIVHFMFHDRVSFGGSLIAIGALYMWMAEFPLRQRQPWAWWLFLVSGVSGFATFLCYLGYGYLDTWHGMATLALLPVYAWGMVQSRQFGDDNIGIESLLKPSVRYPRRSSAGMGRFCLLLTAVAIAVGGLTIMVVGMTCVFVPQDLEYMGLSVAQLQAINPHLIPLIAHDRAGFGGGLCSTGIAVFFCVRCGTPSRSHWQVICLAGVTGFGCAIGIHPLIGYMSLSHLAPAVMVAIIYCIGVVLSYGPMVHANATRFKSPAQSPQPRPS